MIKEIERIDDGVIFSLNDDIDLNNIYMSGNRDDCEKKESYSIAESKKKWPDKMHQGYSSHVLLRDGTSFRKKRESFPNLKAFITDKFFPDYISQDHDVIKLSDYLEFFDFKEFFYKNDHRFSGDFELTFFEDGCIDVEYF